MLIARCLPVLAVSSAALLAGCTWHHAHAPEKSVATPTSQRSGQPPSERVAWTTVTTQRTVSIGRARKAVARSGARPVVVRARVMPVATAPSATGVATPTAGTTVAVAAAPVTEMVATPPPRPPMNTTPADAPAPAVLMPSPVAGDVAHPAGGSPPPTLALAPPIPDLRMDPARPATVGDASPSPTAAAMPSSDGDEEARRVRQVLVRAQALIRYGRLVEARAYLETQANGSGEVLFALAETWDPNALQQQYPRFRSSGDVAQAKVAYRAARAAGALQADARLEALASQGP